MATARHHGRGEVVLRRQRFDGDYEPASGGGFFELVDRPLRRLSAGDAALLTIFRATLIGSVAAAIGAVTVSAIW